MQTWARRGLQTALVTGGLLMLGTGIASAHENVSPDRPASPIDGGVTIPVHVGNNALGTPFGQKDLPSVNRTISTNQATGALPQSANLPVNDLGTRTGGIPAALSKTAPTLSNAVPVVTRSVPALTKAVPGLSAAAPSLESTPAAGSLPTLGSVPALKAPVLHDVSVLGRPLPGLADVVPAAPTALPSSAMPTALPSSATDAVPGLDNLLPGDSTQAAPLAGDPMMGNRGRADVVVPVDISGNAIAAGGPATAVNNDDNQSVGSHDPVISGWDPGALTNNVVAVNYAAPVQLTNNAVSAAGTANAVGTSNQSATTGGDITTSGSNRSLSGNVIAGQLATPVQVAGNAVAGGGQAHSQSTDSTAAHSNGSVLTDGGYGSGSGNVAAVPLAVPAEVTGQAIGGGGIASAAADASANTTAGSTDREAPRGSVDRASTMPGYVQTNGVGGVLSGNGAVPAAANPVDVAGNAVSGIANTNTNGSTGNTAQAGGFTTTNGTSSTASGNLAGAALADPAHVFGNGAAAIGNASGVSSNSENANAGGISYANGTGGVLAGNDANAPVAGSNDVFGSAASGIGNAGGTGANDVVSNAGGYTGTNGGNGTGAGNIVQMPIAAPAEVFGSAGSLGGGANGSVPAESKTITAGGNSNTLDDYGTLSSNVVDTPTAAAGQVFGNAAGLVANTAGSSDSATTVTAGGDATGTGHEGTGSGNVVRVPTSLPAQVFNSAVTGVGNGTAIGANTTNMGAGGDTTANGSGGSLAGNVVSVPNAGPVQVFGDAVSAAANDAALSDSQTTSWAGGNTNTDGTGGSVAGNVVSAQVVHTAQVFGDAVGAAGNALGHGTNELNTSAGGTTVSHGDWGSVSGNLVTVPAAALAQVFASGVAAAGNTSSLGANLVNSSSGGPATTTGAGSLSGFAGQVPVGVVAQVYRVPVQVLGRALVAGANSTQTMVGEDPAAVDVPLSLRNAPTAPQFALPAGTDALLPIGAMPNLATLPLSFPHLATPGLPGLPALPALSGLPATPGLPSLGALPGVSRTQDQPVNLPDLPSVPGTPSLPGVDSVSGDLPGIHGFSGDLPLVGTLPTRLPTQLPSTQTSLPEVPLTTLPKVPEAGSLPAILSSLLPSTEGLLPTQGLTTQSQPAVPGVGSALSGTDLPVFNAPVLATSLPSVGTLPSVGADGVTPAGVLPTSQLPTAGLVDGAQLPSVGSLTGAPQDLSNLRSLPADAGTLPGSADLPGLDELAGLGSLPSFGSLPELPALPGLSALSASSVPATQSMAFTPGLTGSQLPELPALSGLLGSTDVPALTTSDAAAGSLRNLAGHGLDGVQLPNV